MPINRPQDVLTGSTGLEILHRFESFPVFMGCVDHACSEDVFADMDFYISKSSGMIQMNPLLPLEAVYPVSHGSGRVGPSWDAHHQAFAGFIASSSPSKVLEIGGGHGMLSMRYNEISAASWIIIEPNPDPVEGCQATLIKGFFDKDFRLCEDVDAVVHSHVFEHMYAPLDFLESLKSFIKLGKRLIFSVPNMRVMLERKFTNCLNFEHTLYLADYYIEWMLANCGFRIENKEYFRSDHSIFYSAIRDDKITKTVLDNGLYYLNKNLYLSYIDEHYNLICTINSRLANVKHDEIFLFGAHVQSQYLIAFGLDVSRVRLVLDNDVSKKGKRLYGTTLFVEQPDILISCKTPLVIIRAGTFHTEITKQILKINPATEFLQ